MFPSICRLFSPHVCQFQVTFSRTFWLPSLSLFLTTVSQWLLRMTVNRRPLVTTMFWDLSPLRRLFSTCLLFINFHRKKLTWETRKFRFLFLKTFFVSWKKKEFQIWIFSVTLKKLTWLSEKLKVWEKRKLSKSCSNKKSLRLKEAKNFRKNVWRKLKIKL